MAENIKQQHKFYEAKMKRTRVSIRKWVCEKCHFTVIGAQSKGEAFAIAVVHPCEVTYETATKVAWTA